MPSDKTWKTYNLFRAYKRKRWRGEEEERRGDEGAGGGEETYSWFEGNELEDHLHSENPGEDHVEDVHGIIKEMRLAVMLKSDGSDILIKH